MTRRANRDLPYKRGSVLARADTLIAWRASHGYSDGTTVQAAEAAAVAYDGLVNGQLRRGVSRSEQLRVLSEAMRRENQLETAKGFDLSAFTGGLLIPSLVTAPAESYYE